MIFMVIHHIYNHYLYLLITAYVSVYMCVCECLGFDCLLTYRLRVWLTTFRVSE